MGAFNLPWTTMMLMLARFSPLIMATRKGTTFFALLLLSATLVLVLFSSCGGDEEDKSDSSQNEPQGVETPLPSPTPKPTPTPVVKDENEAIRTLWVYLTRCISIDMQHLQANRGSADSWIVMPTEMSPQEFGTWRVTMSGSVLPHNVRAESWEEYVASYCDTALMQPAATDVLNQADAVTAVWTQLAKCNPELPIGTLLAQKNRKTGSWVVVTSPSSNDDYGVWSVARDANITPLNDRAKDVFEALKLEKAPPAGATHTELAAQCSPVLRNSTEAANRLWSHLASCFPTLKTSTMKTTWDPGKHLWIVVTFEGSDTSGSVWGVPRSGVISAVNKQAEATDKKVSANKC